MFLNLLIGLNGRCFVFFFALITGIVVGTSSTSAQVNGPGPSNSLDFDTLINLPNDPVFGNQFVAFGGNFGGISGQSTQINVAAGGSTGGLQNFNEGVELNIVGGSLGAFTLNNAELNLADGEIVSGTHDINDGSIANISGGTINNISANSGSVVNISGGIFGFPLPGNASINANPGSTLNVTGGTFNGFFSIDNSDVAISDGDFNSLFDVDDAVLSITGGDFETFDANQDSVVSISNGNFEEFDALPGSVVDISGGTFSDILGSTDNFEAQLGSTVNISGGVFGDDFIAGGNVNISNGTFGDNFGTRPNSVVNISGGTFGDEFFLQSGTELNLIGSEFSLGGVEIAGLVLDQAFVIDDRDTSFSGRLADGSEFEFFLDDFGDTQTDFFSSAATLTVTLSVPEPSSAILMAFMFLGCCSRRTRV